MEVFFYKEWHCTRLCRLIRKKKKKYTTLLKDVTLDDLIVVIQDDVKKLAR
jgi:hypothetical protein